MADTKEFMGTCEELGGINEWGKGNVKVDGDWYTVPDKSLYLIFEEGSSYAIGWETTQKPPKAGGGAGRPKIVHATLATGAEKKAGASSSGVTGSVDAAAKQRSIELQTITNDFAPFYVEDTGGINVDILAADVNDFWVKVFGAPVDKFHKEAVDSGFATEEKSEQVEFGE